MTLQTLYFVNLALGLIACAALTVFCLVTWARKITGRAAFSAALLSFLMFSSFLLIGLGPASFALEVAASMAWITLLLRAIGVDMRNAWSDALRPVTGVFVAAAGLAALMIGYAATTPATTPEAFFNRGWFTGQVLLAISGLVLLEQVVRNTREEMRSRLRYLNIGIGTLFTFLLVHNACGLLFSAYLPVLVVVHPAVFAVVAPLVAVGLTQNAEGPLKLNLSRRFVFGSGVLTATGAFLLALGVLGYLVRTMDGDWAAALLVLIFLVAVVASAVVFSHTPTRVRGRRWIEEHLFPSKYDYREEWRRVTAQLTEPSPDYDLPQQVLRALSRVLHTEAGAVWRVSDGHALVPVSQWHTNWAMPWSRASTERLTQVFQEDESVVDLGTAPSAGPTVNSLPEIKALHDVRFLVPLLTGSRLFGLAALKNPPINPRLDWEDRALLRLVARESAGFLALREAERELADSDKLRGYNQMSAFVVHDVKTISSQLSLMLENAQRHKTNPAFIDDMIGTVDNAVIRMQKLLTQLRENGEVASQASTDLVELLRDLLAGFERHDPTPGLRVPDHPVRVQAEPAELSAAIGHIVQNGIDAAAGTCRSAAPKVSVELLQRDRWAEVVVTDSGRGMDKEFIDDVLFQPLTSTKGVAGMGVGAYQARTYLRRVGGDIRVESWPGRGSRFTLSIPLQDES